MSQRPRLRRLLPPPPDAKSGGSPARIGERPGATPPIEHRAQPASPGVALDTTARGDRPLPADPPFAGPLEAGLRHPALALIPLLLLVAGALAFGLARSPVYSAEARVNVGRVDVPAYTLQGVVVGNEALAAGYARAVTAQPVAVQAGRAVGLSPGATRSQLSASPIPGSTLIRVEANGSSERKAVKLANAGSTALAAYVERLNRDARSPDLLRRFRDAQTRELKARAQVRREELRRARRFSRNDLTSGGYIALREARLSLSAADLEVQRLRNEYQQSGSGSDLKGLLQVIAPAAEASSDRSSVLQRLIFLALAAGLVLGLGLALLRANRGLLRRPRA